MQEEGFPEIAQLHEMNPKNRFSDRATAYAKYHPSYPAEAIAPYPHPFNYAPTNNQGLFPYKPSRSTSPVLKTQHPHQSPASE